jgi:glycerol-3-phosphate acyltransferase PlsY
MALLAMAAAYLLGSIPTAYLLGRLQGIDIRQAGSGNVGTMNARLVLGWRSALLVLLLDLAKGMLSVWLAVILHINPCLLLLLAVIGHICSLWLRGQGGKGLAAACGGMLVLHQWLPLLIFCLAWLVVYLVLRNSDKAALAGALFFGAAAVVLGPPGKGWLLATALTIAGKHLLVIRRGAML